MNNLNIEAMVKNEVEKAVMQSIEDLGIKAIMREKIVDAGITKDDVREMISECVDSYVRSVNIEFLVRNQVSSIIEKKVRDYVKEMFDSGSYDYRPNSVMRKTIEDEVRKALYENFSFSFNIEPRDTTN